MHALCLNFNMHVPVKLHIQFRLYFSGSNTLNVYSFDICFKRSFVALLRYSQIFMLLENLRNDCPQRGTGGSSS